MQVRKCLHSWMIPRQISAVRRMGDVNHDFLVQPFSSAFRAEKEACLKCRFVQLRISRYHPSQYRPFDVKTLKLREVPIAQIECMQGFCPFLLSDWRISEFIAVTVIENIGTEEEAGVDIRIFD